MNFYKRYPADYAKKTSRLTLAQHGAYTLLLDEMYVTEAPLPASMVELYRICRAMSKPEQEAVQIVVERYFPIGADGLRHNDRADEEITAAAPAMEAARLNGKKGGRPRKETQEKPNGFSAGNPQGTRAEPKPKAPHSSDNSPSGEGEKRANAPPRPADVAEQTWSDWRQLRKTKRAPVTETVLAGAREQASLAGLSLERFLQIWCARGSQGLQADWLKPQERASSAHATTASRRAETIAGLTNPGEPHGRDDRTVDVDATVVVG